MKFLILVSLLFCSSVALSEDELLDFINTLDGVETQDDQINTGVQGKIFEAKQVTVELSRINDVGFLIVLDQNGTATIVASAEQTLGITGSVTTDLEPYLQDASNLLIFALWNREGKNIDLRYWEKTFLSGYSYKYRLIGDGTTLYKLEGDEKGKAGIVYWNAFFIDKNDNNLTISPVTTDIQAQINRVFESVSNNTALTATNQKAVNLGANIATALMKW